MRAIKGVSPYLHHREGWVIVDDCIYACIVKLDNEEKLYRWNENEFYFLPEEKELDLKDAEFIIVECIKAIQEFDYRAF